MKIQLRRGSVLKLEGFPVTLDQDTEIVIAENNWKLIQELKKNNNQDEHIRNQSSEEAQQM